MNRSRPLLLTLILLLLQTSFVSAQVKICKEEGKWQLDVNGKPFEIKGVTYGKDHDDKNVGKYMKELKYLGVNTIRLWGTSEKTKMLLDTAYAYDINVMVGIWLRHGRPGMEGDDSFDYLTDINGMKDMYNDAMNTVNIYKDHPAVLTWGVGNEVYLNIATDKEKKAYSEFLERICSDIKEKDPNHPVTSVEAWTFGLKWWKKYVPSVDIYGINSYGAGVNMLPSKMEEAGIDKPYIVTEFGVSGEWDATPDSNGIKVEPSDNQKYYAIATGYNDWIKPKPNCLGVYVFHYGDGNDFGSPWLLFYHDGCYRPQYWATREAYTGKKPDNYIPKIVNFKLPTTTKSTGDWIPVTLEALDVENEDLEFSFHYNQRTGSRKRRSQINKLVHRGNYHDGFEILLPAEYGAIKVYVNVKDTYNNLGIASTSYVIDNGIIPENLNLVAKGKLPFYVYKDGREEPYIPTAYMGNFKMMGLDMKNTRYVKNGNHAMQISYGDSGDWFGVGFVDPPDDWGDKLGGYNLSGAKTFSFWAKASSDYVQATIGFGLIGEDKPYHDTEKKSVKISLTTEWKKYTIDLRGSDLSCIRSGLTVYSNGSGSPQFIWLDDVVFE